MRIQNAWTLWCTTIVAGLLSACVPAQTEREQIKDDGQDSSSLVTVDQANVVPNKFIVVMNPLMAADANAMTTMSDTLGEMYSANVEKVFNHAIKGFVADMTPGDAMALSEDPNVLFVEPDQVVHAIATQPNATWGLDRIDQRDLPTDTDYNYFATGAGVEAYIIDTGIRTTHVDFEGRATFGFNSTSDPDGDGNGHGTHVAGTVGGSTWGVAKNVQLIGVKVLTDSGSGTNAGVIAGVDWVTQQKQNNPSQPMVANMSLGGGASSALDQAVQNSIAAGVTYALAAGNETTDACTRSPARTPEAITVGSTTNSDARSSFSNFGTCVDIFAPGSGITSTWIGSDTDTNTISGTSMASPHVAGAAALFLSAVPTATPQEVRDALVNQGSTDRLSDIRTGSPNVLLYSAFIGSGGDITAPTVTITAPADGASVSGTVNVTADATDDTGVTEVSLYVDGALVAGPQAPPATFTWDSLSVLNGDHTLQVRAQDAASNSGSDTITVNAQNAGNGEIASFDPAFGAPRCSGTTRACDTGTGITGRGTVGPEANASNTIDGCTDGNSGSYQGDESLERLVVSAAAPFEAGQIITIDADVWAWSTGTSDNLDLFHAPDANNPVWTLIATIQPPAGGAQTLSATFTLPAGGAAQQAIRGQFRYTSTPDACSSGSYNDRDDLVFNVGTGGGGDIVAPTASISSPSSGDTVRGTVDVIYTASDNVGVDTVELVVDGTVEASGPNGIAFSWDSASAADGTHTLEVRATDAAGNVGAASVSVTSDNVDTEAPSASITAPSTGDTVSGSVVVSYTSADNFGVVSADLLVDGTVVASSGDANGSFTWDSTTVTDGTHTLEVAVSDAAGNTADSDPVSVTVQNSAAQDGIAQFDGSLGAPACQGGNFRSCDTDALVLRRGTVGGGEPNASNTLDGCADGNSGSYQNDESIEAIRISTVSGGAFAGGVRVRVEVDVWAWSTGSSDRLDVYRAADANSPSWVPVATSIVAPGADAQTMVVEYDLPSVSGLQAVRAQFRYRGSASSCTSGSWNDRDDLVFQVN